jgi:hypothetical protein
MKVKYWQALAGLVVVTSAAMYYFGYYTPVVPFGVVVGGFALAGYVRRLEKNEKAQITSKR